MEIQHRSCPNLGLPDAELSPVGLLQVEGHASDSSSRGFFPLFKSGNVPKLGIPKSTILGLTLVGVSCNPQSFGHSHVRKVNEHMRSLSHHELFSKVKAAGSNT